MWGEYFQRAVERLRLENIEQWQGSTYVLCYFYVTLLILFFNQLELTLDEKFDLPSHVTKVERVHSPSTSFLYFIQSSKFQMIITFYLSRRLLFSSGLLNFTPQMIFGTWLCLKQNLVFKLLFFIS